MSCGYDLVRFTLGSNGQQSWLHMQPANVSENMFLKSQTVNPRAVLGGVLLLLLLFCGCIRNLPLHLACFHCMYSYCWFTMHGVHFWGFVFDLFCSTQRASLRSAPLSLTFNRPFLRSYKVALKYSVRKDEERHFRHFMWHPPLEVFLLWTHGMLVLNWWQEGRGAYYGSDVSSGE